MADEKGTVELLIDMKEQISSGLERIEKTAQKTLGNTEKRTNQTKKSFLDLGKALPLARFASFAGAVALVTTAFSGAVKVGAEYEQTMADLKAVTVPTVDEFQNLSEKAREMGATTASSAVEAGKAMIELGKNGFEAAESISAVESVLNIANGTGEEMAKTAEIMAATINQFGLEAEQSAMVSDVMAKSFNSSALNLERFGEAMKFAGPAAKASGEDIVDTTAALELLSNNAVNGTMAGNVLKRMFIDLGTSSSSASKVLAGLGVSSTASFEEKLIALNEAGLEFSDTAEIFGKISATSAQILIDGAHTLDDYSDALENATGAAEKMAETRLDTLQGDIKLLDSAIKELGISFSEKTNPAIREAVQLATEMTTQVNEGEGVFGNYSKAVSEVADNLWRMIPGLNTAIGLYKEIKDLVFDEEADSTGVELMGTDTTLEAMEKTNKSLELGFEARRKMLEEQRKKTSDALKGAGIGSSGKEEAPLELVAFGGGTAEKLEAQQLERDKKEAEIYQRQRLKLSEQNEQLTAQNEEYGLTNLQILEMRKEKELKILDEFGLERAETEKYYDNKILDEKTALDKKEAELQKSRKKSYQDTGFAIADSLLSAIEANTKSAKKLKLIALGEVQMNAARAVMNAWASGPWQENLAETIAIGAQQTAATAMVAKQNFTDGGKVKPEMGVPRTGDNIMVGVNPEEEILPTSDPRHIDNLGAGGMGGETININISGNIGTDEEKLAEIVVNALDYAKKTGRPLGS